MRVVTYVNDKREAEKQMRLRMRLLDLLEQLQENVLLPVSLNTAINRELRHQEAAWDARTAEFKQYPDPRQYDETSES